MIDRLSVLKTILWASVGLLGAVTAVRFTHGLGAVTNLSDAAPWGLWVAFDVMAGVALAAGGFVLAATVYIFHLEEYRCFARPAILTALLGYLAVAVGLLYDLGLPWHIWHPIIYPQYQSVLFEVAMCVMLYLTVLALEFAPVVLEHPFFAHPWFQRILRAIKKMTMLLIVAGIVLSTLHQSSLGSLFLITPYRLHALWYSPIIYVLFFVSAVGLGLMTVVSESLFAGFFLNHKIHKKLLAGLGLAAAGVLGLYAVLRLGDLAVRGVLFSALDGSWQSLLFLFEIAVGAILPAVLLLSRRVRSSIGGLALCAGLTVFGMVLYRLDVCIIAFARPEGASYFPSWMEIAVSLGIVSGGILIFIFFVERLKVYEDNGQIPAPGRPSYDPATLHGLLPYDLASPRRYSLAAVIAAAVAVMFLPVQGVQPVSTPVFAPRTVEGASLGRDDGDGQVLTLASFQGAASSPAKRMPLIAIDGNRDGRLVLFNHDAHIEREGGDRSCTACHHLNLPLDCSTSCYQCHRDMYEPTSLFDHAYHVRSVDGNDGCSKCHTDYRAVKNYETATGCAECHDCPASPSPIVAAPGRTWRDAPGYVDAMHGLCVTCHRKRIQLSPGRYSEVLKRCDNCHDADLALEMTAMTPAREPGSRVLSDERHGASGKGRVTVSRKE
jgi:Ni/Fe-hydrogenase subunit HybB-like protein